MKYIFIVTTLFLLTMSTSSATPLTLDEAMERMKASNPKLTEAEAKVRVAKGLERQAGLRINPSLSLENEEMSTSKLGNFGESNTTLAFSQTVDLWAKIPQGKKIAEAEVLIAKSGYESLVLELAGDLLKAYAGILVTQERIQLTSHLVESASKLFETTKTQVESGARPISEQLRSEVEFHRVEARQKELQSELTEQRQELALLIGEASSSPSHLEGDLVDLARPVDTAPLIERLDKHPVLIVQSHQVEANRRKLALTSREYLPDPEFTLGMEFNRVENDNNLVMGIAIPLPLFNRNQGSIEAASADIDASVAAQQSIKLELESRIRTLDTKAGIIRSSISDYDNQILPEARRANDLVQEGFKLGAFDYLEALSSQTALVDTEVEKLELTEKLIQVQAPLVSLERFWKAE